MTPQSASGSFTAAAVGAGFPVDTRRPFNVSIGGPFSATLQLERQFTGDPNWYPVAISAAGGTVQFGTPRSFAWQETEEGVSYRLNCTAFTSGPIPWRLSQ